MGAVREFWRESAISAAISAEEQTQQSQDEAASSTSEKNASLM